MNSAEPSLLLMIGTVAVAWKWPAADAILLVLASMTSIGIWVPMCACCPSGVSFSSGEN
jgi:hypothetical protein